jgi:FkbM family methyltransferase
MDLLGFWTSERSRFGLRMKQAVAALVPEPALALLKKRYYARLLSLADHRHARFLEPEIRALLQLVSPGDFAIDVGAFVGSYTKELSAIVGSTGLVWSIEPVPQNFEILRYVTKRFGFTNVRLLNYALSDSIGLVRMQVPRYKGGGECWYDTRIAGESTASGLRTFTVNATTLDTLALSSDRPVAFIKCDAEYHELQVLIGAQKTIKRYLPVLMVEVLRRTGDKMTGTEPEAVGFLRNLGYTPYSFLDPGFRQYAPDVASQNVFFMTQSHLRTLDLRARSGERYPPTGGKASEATPEVLA